MSDDAPISPFQAQLGVARLPDDVGTEDLRDERDPHLSGGSGARVVSVKTYLAAVHGAQIAVSEYLGSTVPAERRRITERPRAHRRLRD